jgi:hypothetical protein
MTVTVDPFAEEHLQPAAALLAARHRRDRAAAPDLPPRFEDAAATVPVLRELFAQDGMAGVVAVREGRLIGFLLGAPALGSPTAARAGYLHPRSVDIPHAAHAVEPGDGGTLYQRLYAALAERWVTRGLPAHYVTVSAEPEAAAA